MPSVDVDHIYPAKHVRIVDVQGLGRREGRRCFVYTYSF